MNAFFTQIIAHTANCGVVDADTAVHSARAAFNERWGYDTTARQRGDYIYRLFGLLNDNHDELARILCTEQACFLWEEVLFVVARHFWVVASALNTK